ncbi:MAG TPA: hypothetical protein VNV35_11840 [Puia sp.]|nr:hypothetical protein [Puia sp.]
MEKGLAGDTQDRVVVAKAVVGDNGVFLSGESGRQQDRQIKCVHRLFEVNGSLTKAGR